MKKKNFLTAGFSIFMAMLLFWACSKNNDSGDNGGTGNDPNKIYMKNAVFSNTNLTITVGGTVTWVNDDNMVHTVTANDASFNSGDIQVGASFSKTFAATGVYPYHCIYHSGMTGTIVVVTK